ncbi:TRAP transporter substrate-binding protein [Aurantimonas sp. C2-6-R+9]|uniref:TRAP transporter substrate-binding protein n=1 Tax=unclassified Aurantimonas TaxID=2638230 RepID=UPI002E176EA5|nr:MULTISPECIES: TRAP transporter substrate-binding protein [unclassified Aurantimonas]MEC5293255.1 TRAP transporter substrate-binding protein [Aurantimonas sp. C2-3-R2]MEC5383396.1 TRAP transporter substrate-binding protein [Aurantimonas sp. C2-6-R+9]MEC5414349.1 TRAP transporter substrate-binding protein [Aurantimonas sp. C2-4-R8]
MKIRNGLLRRDALKLGLGATALAASGFRPAHAQSKTIRIAHHVSIESDQQRAAERFRDLVGEYTNDAIQVEILPSAQMGGQREIIESVSLGTLEMGYGESGLYSNYASEFGVLALPYLYRDLDHWQTVVTGDVGRSLSDKLAGAAGMRIVNWINGGYRQTFLRSKAIEKPEDFEGVKIRVPESPVFVKTFAALGASPTPIPAPEIYTSLQTGVVDAMEGSPETGYTYKIFEVADYLSLTNHILLDGSYVINQAFLDSLSDEERDAVMRAASEAGDAQRAGWTKVNADWLTKLGEVGLKVNEVDTAPFQKVLGPLQDSFAEEAGATEYLKQIRAA